MVILRHYKTDSDKKRLPCHDCGAHIAVVIRRAKDGDTNMSGGVVGMDGMDAGRFARTVPVAGPAHINVLVRQGLVASSRRSNRMSGVSWRCCFSRDAALATTA
jgi:hypothetical protein